MPDALVLGAPNINQVVTMEQVIERAPERVQPTGTATVRARTSFVSQIVTLIAVVVPAIGVLSAMGLLWGVAFNWVDLATMIVFYVFTGLGITVGFHRLFSHKSFKCKPWVRAFWAIMGSMAMQGPLTQWVTDHRKHHALSDREGDPHSPHVHGHGTWERIHGFMHSHVLWLFTTKGLERGRKYGRDMYDDPMIRRIDRMYLVWVLLTGGIPFLIGYFAGGMSVSAGVQTMVWAFLVRVFLYDHATWAVNSVCHTIGKKPYNNRDESRNNWVIAALVFGEGWHNNHHAFPGSAVHGLERRQIDLSAMTITLMEKMGLAWGVKRPSTALQARMKAVAVKHQEPAPS